MYIPEIPNNSLTDRIKTIIELSEEIIKDNVKGVFKFCNPISEEEIEFLLKDAWWEKDLQWIREHALLFESISEYRQAVRG